MDSTLARARATIGSSPGCGGHAGDRRDPADLAILFPHDFGRRLLFGALGRVLDFEGGHGVAHAEGPLVA